PMSLIAFLIELKELNVVISQKEGRLAVKGNKAALTGDIKTRLSANKDAIGALYAKLGVKNNRQFAPLTQSQQRLWFICQMAGNNVVQNMCGNVLLRGDINHEALLAAFKTIVQRHAGLRSTFIVDGDSPQVLINRKFTFQMPIVDLSGYDADEQKEQIKRQIALEGGTEFQLDKDVMLRARLLILSSNEVVLLHTMHHIASDGWSLGVFTNELSAIYSAFDKGLPDPLPPLVIQFADFAHWERQRVKAGEFDNQLDYWLKRLEGLPLKHNLPLDKPRPSVKTFKGAMVEREISGAVFAGFNRLCSQQGATLFMGINALLALLMSRYSGEKDIVIGTLSANREHPDVAPLIGYFLNTLVLRNDLKSATDFNALLKQSKNTILGAFEHQQLPFEKLIHAFDLSHSNSYSPIFQVLLIVQSNDAGEAKLSDLTFAAADQKEPSAKFDLTLYARAMGDTLHVGWEYSTDLFDANTIEQMAEHFNQLLALTVQQPTALLARLPMLSEAEQQAMLAPSQNKPASKGSDEPSCIHQLFEANAHKTPSAVAVVDQDEQLTYSTLNKKANQLAHYLIEQGVKPDTLVGLGVARSTDMLVGLLAILKAGGAYVPLDPSYPKSRLDFMIKDSGIKLLLDNAALQRDVSGYSDENPAKTLVDSQITGDNLAYVIYTSGSTGQPKGVMVTHNNVLSYCYGARALYGVEATDRILQFSSVSFDIFVEETFLALSFGATLVLRNEAVMSGGSHFWQFMNQHNITVMSLPTAFWHMLCNDLDKAQLSSLSALRLVILGGEAMSLTMLKRWQGKASSDIRLFNTYGPTEGTVIATAFDATDWQAQHSLPIGQALSNTHTLVLDENQQLCPKGVHGELHIGGQGLARGYLNQPQMTAERFIQNPFAIGGGKGADNNDARLYKTGDVVRTLADGNLEFIGRIDDQVKIRGFRVELGEIEHQLSQLAQIGEAVVLFTNDRSRESVPADKQLVAYLTCHGPIETESLREHLHELLPEYMVPAFFVVLDELPLTANGKVDKAALPAPDAVQVASQDETPVTATQIKLAELWAKLLRIEVEELSNTSNFFKTGGHSLLAIRLVGELRAGFEVELMVKDIFDSPELAALAALIDKSLDKDTRPQVVALKRTSNRLPTSFAQQRLW
ncbi:MAG: amino acid adenylation domain-containing protein, partial [Psychrosphaera sp.]|nr:amino acid adenylation domain-containing protein [Psychrosphaera sp.]